MSSSINQAVQTRNADTSQFWEEELFSCLFLFLQQHLSLQRRDTQQADEQQIWKGAVISLGPC